MLPTKGPSEHQEATEVTGVLPPAKRNIPPQHLPQEASIPHLYLLQTDQENIQTDGEDGELALGQICDHSVSQLLHTLFVGHKDYKFDAGFLSFHFLLHVCQKLLHHL